MGDIEASQRLQPFKGGAMNVQLKGVLQTCSFHVLLLIVSQALARSGYGDVRIMDRRTPKQKTRFGGHELVCDTLFADQPARVIVKVLQDSARVRNLDELAGAVIRMKADAGVLVTASHITQKARAELGSYNLLRTQVIDGDALASLLTRLRIGVRGKEDVDFAFFGELEAASNMMLQFIDSAQI